MRPPGLVNVLLAVASDPGSNRPMLETGSATFCQVRHKPSVWTRGRKIASDAPEKALACVWHVRQALPGRAVRNRRAGHSIGDGHRGMSLKFASLLLLLTLAGGVKGQPAKAASLMAVKSGTLTEHRWQAQWIWGHEPPHGHLGFFRREWLVKEGLVSAWAQVSGDDGYTLFVNSRQAAKGGFWWKKTDRLDLTTLLHKGTNVLGARIDNAADPGGWLMEVTLSYRDGHWETMATDRNWRFADQEQPGWTASGFNDQQWLACVEMGRPPDTLPWGYLPHAFLGRRVPIEIEESQLPAQVEAGQSLAGSLRLRVVEPPRGDLACTLQLSKDGETCLEREWSLNPAPNTWKRGETVRITLPEVPISRFLPGGRYTVHWGVARTEPATNAGLGFAAAEIEVRGREGKLLTTEVGVKSHQGAPALWISGQPVFPMWFFQWRIQPEDAVAFGKAGINVFTFDLPLGWVGEGRYDFGETDRAMINLLNANPQALVVPRVMVSAPEWWLDQHPDQAVRFANGVGWQANGWGGTKHESFASELWKKEGSEALRQFVRHVRNSPYSESVIGVHVANGIYGEWHAWSATDLPDTSEPMRAALIRRLQARYRDAGAWSQAWGLTNATFESATLPTIAERHAGEDGMFHDPAVSRKVMDYYECLHAVSIEAIERFCQTVKDESQGKLLTCVFYSYAPDLVWPQEGDHRAAARAHRTQSIDIFSSPHSYERRKLGQDGLFRNYPAALSLHGKLFIDEGDDRTSLANDPPFTHVKTMGQTLEVLRREFANAVTHGVGLWYMDQQNNWFHDPKIMAELARLKSWANTSMSRPRHSVSQVAVLSALESEFYVAGRDSGRNHVTGALYNGQVGELCRTGAPFDWYLIEDLEAGLLPPYKAYVFLDCFHITPAQRQAIEKLKSDHRTLIWFYAPGYACSDKLSVEDMATLTGLPLERIPRGKLEIALQPAAFPGAPPKFGPGQEQSPMFTASPADGQILGAYSDSQKPGLVSRDAGVWRSVYCGAPLLPAAVLRKLFAEAGVHIYSDRGDNLMANAAWLSLHTVTAGRKLVRLPQAAPVFDITRNTLLSAETQTFEVDLPAGATGIYLLADPAKD